MPRRRAAVTTSDITRALKGVLAAGVTIDKIAGVKLTGDGLIIFLGDASTHKSKETPNEWDQVLK